MSHAVGKTRLDIRAVYSRAFVVTALLTIRDVFTDIGYPIERFMTDRVTHRHLDTIGIW